MEYQLKKMAMKRFLIVLFSSICVGVSTISYAQDIHFSQFTEISTLRNPALTGIFSGDYKFGLDYRTQWAAVATPYTTTALSGETRILVDRNTGDYLSFGLDITYDNSGSISFVTGEIYPAICFNKCMEDERNTYISLGLTGGYFFRSVDMGKIKTSSQYVNLNYDPTNPSYENTSASSLSNYDVGAGVSVNSTLDYEGKTSYYIGGAVYHLNHPTEIFSGSQNLVKLPLKMEGNAGIHFNISDQVGLSLHANYSYQNPYSESVFGGYLTWRNNPVAWPSTFAMSLGFYVRPNDAIIPMVKFDIHSTSIGLSFDVTNSYLGTAVAGTGATELTVFVKGKYNHVLNARDNVRCPNFDDKTFNHFR
jgi:type IX secretion system PorP/SprF family membrane protein